MTMTDDSLLKTGNTSGGQSGLRFNPRQTAGDEVGYGVSHTKYNPRDPDEKATDDDEKAKKKEKRAHAKAGLQHIKVKVKNKKREQEEEQKKLAEISDLTGPAASRGGDLDQAVGAMTGTGSAMGGGVGGVPPELPGTGAFGQGGAFVRAFSVLKDQESMGTETIESVRQKERGVRAARTMRDSGKTRRRRRRGGEPLRVKRRYGRHQQHPYQRVSTNPEQGTQGRRITSPQYKGLGPTTQSKDYRLRESDVERQELSSSNPSSDIVYPKTTQTGFEHKTPGVKVIGRKRQTPKGGPKAPHAPPTASTPGGAGKTPKIGQATPFALSEDVLEISDLLLKRGWFDPPKAKPRQVDLFEMKQLLREAKKLLEGLTKKSYTVGGGDDAERPSPNASRKQTSYNTGATEVDDDWGSPLEWGAHPYGLLVWRRGQP